MNQPVAKNTLILPMEQACVKKDIKMMIPLQKIPAQHAVQRMAEHTSVDLTRS